jgi:CopA family copper-resistance protein
VLERTAESLHEWLSADREQRRNLLMRHITHPTDAELASPLRRTLLQGAAASLMMFALPKVRAAQGQVATLADEVKHAPIANHYDLTLARTQVNITGKPASAVTLNGMIPGPLLHFREGDDVTINLTNRLDEMTSIHWHGLLVPNAMDGVPAVTFPGIAPGETFKYQFKLRQSGTYWYHSHAVLQEPAGFYAPLIIDPLEREPFTYDRDYVVLLSDWIDTPPEKVLANLKKADGYYNYRRQTMGELLEQLSAAKSEEERAAIRRERLGWAQMRMDPTDYSDGGPEWNYLLQGARVDQNWTALFAPGERIRLRIINGAAMNFFDISIPGLEMTVVAADGQNIVPVKVNELRIGNGETYDVIVQPRERKAYTIFAATMARIGFARGTLAPEVGMQAPIPAMGPRPVRKMDEMAGAHSGAEHAQHGASAAIPANEASSHAGHTIQPETIADHSAHAGHVMPQETATGHSAHAGHVGMQNEMQKMTPVQSEPSSHSMPVGTSVPAVATHDRLTYKDLRSLTPTNVDAASARIIRMDLTGDMNRYFWSINGKKLSEATLFEARLNEPLQFQITNKTMMEHPMHVHGAFFTLENGQGNYAPRKHTVIVNPGETVTVNTVFHEKGAWVFHCHLFYHAATGMVQAVVVK